MNELIKKDVTSNSVFLYMKGVPAAPQCGFSDLAVKVLTAYGACTSLPCKCSMQLHVTTDRVHGECGLGLSGWP